MTGFKPTIQIKESKSTNRIYNSVTLVYADVEMRITVINETPKLLIADRTQPSPALKKGVPDALVIAENGLNDNDYQIKEQAIILSIPFLQVLDEFAGSLMVPNGLPAFALLKLKPPYQYFSIDAGPANGSSYLLITGAPEVSFDENCTCRADAVTRHETRHPDGADLNGTTLTYPGPSEVSNMNDPDAVFYVPKLSIDNFSNSILNPAITAGDEGQFLLFKWYWNIAANIDLSKTKIDFDPANFQIVINSAHHIFGNAGIALKIACIYQNILGADFNGNIEPSVLKLSLAMDSGNNVMLYGEYSFSVHVDLNFLVGLDLLLNPILDSILENLAKNKYEFRLRLFNNKFLDLNQFKPMPKYGWRISKDFKQTSFCIGINENRG
jgi:hypothetical protein